MAVWDVLLGYPYPDDLWPYMRTEYRPKRVA